MVRNIKHLIRVKKFKPYYELYLVESNKVSSLVETYNDVSHLPSNLKQIRVILSSIISVEGSRSINLKKLSQTQKRQFFFSHSIISDESELKFSEPIVSHDQLKQLWMGKKDYQDKIIPLVEKYKNKIESIISEKSSFEISQNIIFQDIEGKTETTNNDDIINLELTNFSKQKIPSLISVEKDYFLKIVSFTILFFIFLNFIIFYLNSNPLYNLQMNYFFDNLGISKIENPEMIIQLEQKLTKQITSSIPKEIDKINTLLEELPDNIFIHLTEFNYSENQFILKFINPVSEDVINFLQNINNQSASINYNEDHLEIIYSLEEF
tara:strand:- start:145 stop:1113 length:969 start_codon:yes stop_codon:yes gene_type:complete